MMDLHFYNSHLHHQKLVWQSHPCLCTTTRNPISMNRTWHLFLLSSITLVQYSFVTSSSKFHVHVTLFNFNGHLEFLLHTTLSMNKQCFLVFRFFLFLSLDFFFLQSWLSCQLESFKLSLIICNFSSRFPREKHHVFQKWSFRIKSPPAWVQKPNLKYTSLCLYRVHTLNNSNMQRLKRW